MIAVTWAREGEGGVGDPSSTRNSLFLSPEFSIVSQKRSSYDSGAIWDSERRTGKTNGGHLQAVSPGKVPYHATFIVEILAVGSGVECAYLHHEA